MIDSAANKDMGSAGSPPMPPKTGDPIVDTLESKTSPQEAMQDYHFSGHGEFYAASIYAPNIQAATKVWIQKRVRIHP
jgi:hypothetical protein